MNTVTRSLLNVIWVTIALNTAFLCLNALDAKELFELDTPPDNTRATAPLVIETVAAFPDADIDVGYIDGGETTITNFQRHTLTEISANCPSTSLNYDLGEPHGMVDLVLPRFLTLGRIFRALVDADGREIVVDVPEDGEIISYRILIGTGLACADKAYRPIFLSRSPIGYGRGGNPPLQTFNPDHFAYLCLKLKQTIESEPTWSCLRGLLADGVTGYAIKEQAPRTFWAKSLKWGPNTWRFHYETKIAGLASISWRIPKDKRNGFAHDHEWGLNPRNASVEEYLAGIATKTATNRNGVMISPYNRALDPANPSPVIGKLNPCEPGYEGRRLPQGFVYGPDVASNGRLESEILINLEVAPRYRNPSVGCHWPFIWDLKTTPLDSTGDCIALRIGRDDAPVIGVNLGEKDGALQKDRCPTQIPCLPGKYCCTHDVSVSNTGTAITLADGSVQIRGSINDTGRFADVGVRVDTACGKNFCCTRTTEGRVFCRRQTIQPVEIDTKSYVTWLSAGDRYLYMLTYSGAILFQDLATEAPSTPARVQLDDGIMPMGVSSALDVTCVWTLKGDVWCWKHGQAPTRIPGLDEVRNVSVYGKRACALLRDRTVQCWDTTMGQPKTILEADGSPLSEVLQLARVIGGESRHACARNTAGDVYCWGDNSRRQISADPVSFLEYATPLSVDCR